MIASKTFDPPPALPEPCKDKGKSVRTRQAVPVFVVALSFALLTLGSSSAHVQPPPAQPSEPGLVIGYQPALSPAASKATRTKPPDATPEPARAPTTTAITPRNNPITPEAKAVDVVADQLNGRAFERALDEPHYNEASPADIWGIVTSDWTSSAFLWEELADRLRLKTDPLTFRPLTYNELYEEVEDTGCAYLNADSKEVSASSPVPFYCAADSQGGKMYWPLKSTEERWAASGLPSGTVIRGYSIWLNQLYGQYIAFAVYNTHTAVLGAEALIPPMYDVIGETSFCFAGAAMQASFFDREALLAGMQLIYPGLPERRTYEAALAYGYDQNDLGKCVAKYWPRAL